MTFLRTLWVGDYSLPKAFWLAFVLGNIVAIIPTGIIIFLSQFLGFGTIGFILGFLLFNGYWLIAAVGVWNSAQGYVRSPNWMDRFWGIVARGVIVVAVVNTLWWLAHGGGHFLIQRMTVPSKF